MAINQLAKLDIFKNKLWKIQFQREKKKLENLHHIYSLV